LIVATRMSSVLARPISRSRAEVSLSFFSLLFSEIVSSSHTETPEVHLEDRLHALGVEIGERCLALFHLRDRPYRREINPTSCLQFIANSVWRHLFGHPAEIQATDRPTEFYLVDRSMLLQKFISVSPESALEGSMINCSSFAAGIVEGMMKLAGFSKTKVDTVFTHSGSLQAVEEHMNITFIVSLNPSMDPHPAVVE
jgi:hypothetical protein